MLGIDLDKVSAPFLELLDRIVTKLDEVIKKLDEISTKLDN